MDDLNLEIAIPNRRYGTGKYHYKNVFCDGYLYDHQSGAEIPADTEEFWAWLMIHTNFRIESEYGHAYAYREKDKYWYIRKWIDGKSRRKCLGTAKNVTEDKIRASMMAINGTSEQWENYKRENRKKCQLEIELEYSDKIRKLQSQIENLLDILADNGISVLDY